MKQQPTEKTEVFENSRLRQFAGGRWPLFFAFGLLVVLSIGGSYLYPVRREVSSEEKAVIEANSRFAFELFSTLKERSANEIVSPFSVSSALAMVYGGARGNTEKQMAQTLHFTTNQPAVHSGMTTLLTSLTNPAIKGKVELEIANGLWPHRTYQFAAEFLDLCRQNYHADLDFVDFEKGSDSALRKINSWIGRCTKGKIGNLFAPGAVNAETRLVIANAVYFKGKWASRFAKGHTHSREFWVTPERAVQAPMMSQKSTFLFLSEGDTQIVELPYVGRGISMVILLPKSRDGLPRLQAKLTNENLNHWLDALRPAEVDLLLPKFKMSSRFSLAQTLARVGMPDAFDKVRADFSGMSSQRPLFLNMVEHAAMVEVDEEGTVAAAGTGASFACSQKPPPATFHADHPFIFFILERSTRTLLFIGSVADPGR